MINLKEKDEKAVDRFKREILKEFCEATITLFGSKLTGEDDEFSDIDLLVVLDRKVDTSIEKKYSA